jgi:hypothetical protein
MLDFWDASHQIQAPWAEGGGAGEPLPARGMRAGGWCLYLPRATRLCFVDAPTLAAIAGDVLPAFAAGDVEGLKGDAVVVAVGEHYTEDGAWRAALTAFASRSLTLAPRLPRQLLWRDAPPQHFRTKDGQWEEAVGEGCAGLPGVAVDAATDAVVAASGGDGGHDHHPPGRDPASLLAGGWRNVAADAALARARAAGLLTPLRIWNASLALLPPRDVGQLFETYAKRGGGGVDCSHPCHPSTYQAWAVALAAALPG